MNKMPAGYEFVRIGDLEDRDEWIHPSGNIYTAVGSQAGFYCVIRRIQPKMVPLGPEDIVPGTAIRFADWPAYYFEPVHPNFEGDGIKRLNGSVHTFEHLYKMGDAFYKTPSMTEFAKCEKAAT